MGRPRNFELRAFTDSEHNLLRRTARSKSERADRVAKAKALLSIGQGAKIMDAVRAAGWSSRQAVCQLVKRFNREGTAVLKRRPAGRPPIKYGPSERERILKEFRRTPDREKDGTAVWSLNTLQRALRRAPDGLQLVSTATIWQVLHDAGYTWQASRTWCDTGRVVRKRKAGKVSVKDPQTQEKRG